MLRRRISTKFVTVTLVAVIALVSTSCGTLLYPERRGQPRGVIDSGVLLLDAVGLIFFVVPGLIAFAVDFSTGAIYYPPAPYGGPVTQNGFRRDDLVRVEVPKDELTQAKIEQVVSQETGKPVHLEPGKFRASEMSDIDEFGEQAAHLDGSADDAPPTVVRFK
jgi:hypothetical protein